MKRKMGGDQQTPGTSGDAPVVRGNAMHTYRGCCNVTRRIQDVASPLGCMKCLNYVSSTMAVWKLNNLGEMEMWENAIAKRHTRAARH